LAFEFQFGFVFFKKFSKFFRGFEQPGPLFVVKSHGKSAQAVYANATLFADPEFQAASSAGTLLFEFGQTGFEFFVSGKPLLYH
jgi:hypothetical protein